MATKSFKILAELVDHITNPANQASRSMKNMGKASIQTSINFKDFNRTLFATTAFIGVFTSAFTRFAGVIQEGAETNRLVRQFESAFGPRSQMIKDLRTMTTTTIDQMTFMREALSLKGLGIEASYDRIKSVLVKAGVAAKKAGLDSGEGIKHIAEFLKTSSIANLSFLNILAATNPALKLQLAQLERSGGVMGGVISMQHKMNIAMKLLSSVTKNAVFEEADLLDATQRLSQAFKFFKINIGTFIGKEFTSLINRISEATEGFTDLLERVNKADTTFLKTIGRIISFTGATIGLIGSLGSLRLIFGLLSKLGLGGIPLLSSLLLGLSMSLVDNMNPMETIIKFVEKLGSVLFGVGQIVFSFLGDSKNFGEGVGYMDKKLADFLKKQGLYNLTVSVGRASSVILAFSRDVLVSLRDILVAIVSPLESMVKLLGKLFGLGDKGGLPRLLFGKNTIREILAVVTAGAALFFGISGLMKIFTGQSLVSRIFAGRGEKAPKGTAGDPIYTKEAGAGGAGVAGVGKGFNQALRLTILSAVGEGLIAGFAWADKRYGLMERVYNYMYGAEDAEMRKNLALTRGSEYKELQNLVNRTGIGATTEEIIKYATPTQKTGKEREDYLKEQAVRLIESESFRRGMEGDVAPGSMPDTVEERQRTLETAISLAEGTTKRVLQEVLAKAYKEHSLTEKQLHDALKKAINESHLTEMEKKKQQERKTGTTLALGRC